VLQNVFFEKENQNEKLRFLLCDCNLINFQQLLEVDPALKKFKSYKNSVKVASKIGNVLTAVTIVGMSFISHSLFFFLDNYCMPLGITDIRACSEVLKFYGKISLRYQVQVL
jgi:hypothetical protein